MKGCLTGAAATTPPEDHIFLGSTIEGKRIEGRSVCPLPSRCVNDPPISFFWSAGNLNPNHLILNIQVCKVDVKKPAWEQPTPVHNRWHPGACQLATKCAMPVCVISLFTSRLSDSVSAAVPSERIVNRFYQELTESQRANLCKEQSPLHSKALYNLQTSHLSRRFRKTSFSAWKQSTGQAARSRTTTARMTSSLWT